MNAYHVEVEDIIDATPERVYTQIVGYRAGHPAILPKPFFTDMVVTKGGWGAGTEMTVSMNVLGIRIVYQIHVTEPEPGRVLVEEDPQAGVRTVFTFEPAEGGTKTRLFISTMAHTQAGWKGLLERLLAPKITRHIYRKEMDLLAKAVQDEPHALTSASGGVDQP